MRKEQNKTGGGEVDYSELSDLEKKVRFRLRFV